MKIIKKTWLSLPFVAIALFACNKDSGSNTEQLTKDNWKVTDITFDNVGSAGMGDEDDALADHLDCHLDDEFEQCVDKI